MLSMLMTIRRRACLLGDLASCRSAVRVFVELGPLVGASMSSAGPRQPSARGAARPTGSAKLLTKFSGFLISCAMPAVSWPSEAIFSAWIRLAWAAFSAVAYARFRCIARGADFRLAALALSDVREDQHEVAIGYRVVTDLYHPAVRAGALIGVGFDTFLSKGRIFSSASAARIAALGEIAEVFFEGAVLSTARWAREDLEELPVPCHRARLPSYRATPSPMFSNVTRNSDWRFASS